jgi:hypothetical protein
MDDELYEALKEKLAIDKHALDDEVIMQPQLNQEVSDAVIWQTSIRDQLATDLEVLEARLDKQVRADYAASGDKLTEDMLKAIIKADDDRVAAVHAYLDAKHNVSKLEKLLKSFDQRSYAISKLTDLYESGYFSMDTARRRRSSMDRQVRTVSKDKIKREAV